MIRRTPILIAMLAVAGAAFGHSGVKNPQVMARMDGMVTLGQQAKTLGRMAQGRVTFDASAAEAARAAMIQATRNVPGLFQREERDPMDEAAPEIWTEWDSFLERNDALEVALVAADMSSPEALGMAVREIGRACSACHEDYRIER